jgi:hypothetical protein
MAWKPAHSRHPAKVNHLFPGFLSIDYCVVIAIRAGADRAIAPDFKMRHLFKPENGMCIG